MTHGKRQISSGHKSSHQATGTPSGFWGPFLKNVVTILDDLA